MEMDSGIVPALTSDSEVPPEILPVRQAARGTCFVAAALVASAGAVAATATFAGARPPSSSAASLGTDGTVMLGGTDLLAGKGCYGTPYWGCNNAISLLIQEDDVGGNETACREMCEQTSDCDSFMMHLDFVNLYSLHDYGCLADSNPDELDDSEFHGNCHLFREKKITGTDEGYFESYTDDAKCLTLSNGKWRLEPCDASLPKWQKYSLVQHSSGDKYRFSDKDTTSTLTEEVKKVAGRECPKGTTGKIQEDTSNTKDCYLLKKGCQEGFIEGQCWANIHFKGDGCDYFTTTTDTAVSTTGTTGTTTTTGTTGTTTTTSISITTTGTTTTAGTSITTQPATSAPRTGGPATTSTGSECIANWRHGCRNWEQIEIKPTRTASSASECHDRCRNTQGCVEFNYQPGSCTGSVYDCTHQGSCMLFKGQCDAAPNTFWDHYTMASPCVPLPTCMSNNKCRLQTARTGCDNWDKIHIHPHVTVKNADECCDVCERNANCVGFNFQESPCTDAECAATGTCMIFSGQCNPKKTSSAWDYYVRDDTCGSR